MIKLFGNLKDHKAAVLVIIVLLVVKAFCELALPAYTSDIVDVGIQQGGIEDSVMEKMRGSTFENLIMLSSAEDEKTIREGYRRTSDGNYSLKADTKDEREKLNKAMGSAEMVMYYLEQDKSKYSIEELRSAYKMGRLPKAQILQMKDKFITRMGNAGDLIISQVAVSFVKSEYSAMGLSMGDIQMSYLKRTGAKMLCITLVMILAGIAVCLISSRVGARIGWKLRNSIFSKVLSFSGNEIDKFSTSSLITRSTNDIQQIQMVLIMILRMILYAPILGVGGIIKVLSTRTGLGWIIVLAVAVSLAVVFVLMILAMPRFKKMQSLIDRVNLVSREILTGISVIRAFGREKYEEDRFADANGELTYNQLFISRTMTFMFPLMMLIMNGVSVMIVWFGAKGVDAGNLQVGDMIAFITYAMLIIMAFLMISMISIMLPRAIVSAERIDEVLKTESILKDPEVPRDSELQDGDMTLKFENVSFKYPDAEENVIENISFELSSQQTTAIIGSTGSGKSTLINLIMRFYDVTEGRITVNGIDIREISQKKLHSLMGYIPQKSSLFMGTIESNIKYGGDVSDEEMKRAAEIAQAEEFIESRDGGYEEHIAQGGNNVSGGQKQRLSIARAVAANPQIYLFDDSFSALDYKTDVKLRKALYSGTESAAVLIVAQRISTIIHADCIVMLEKGRIIGKGTHEELMNSCREYRELATTQLSEADMEGGLE